MGDLAHNTIVLIYVPAFCSRAERLPPPLGLLYLGAALRGAGFAVRLFDFQDKRTLWEDVEDCIRASANPLIGITCDSDNKFRVLRISDEILLRFPNARVVLGGPHATYGGDSFVTGRRMLIRGEGEWPIVLLADYVLRGHGSLASIPQLVFEHEGEVASVPAAAGPFANVDSIPFPDYALLSSIEMYQPTMTTSRGCSYRCHFCSEGTAERGYRPRSIPEIERELVALRETYHGRLPGMAFADDTFTASPRRVLELCDVFDRVFPDKADFGFFCEGRVNVLGRHPELVSRLREAGMVRMQIGIEAGDQPTLDRINKRIRIEDIERVINACRKADVPAVHGAFICGLPGQTEADVMNEIEFAKRLVDLSDGRLETSMVALSALPGTEFCVNAGRWGLHLFDSEFASGGLLDGCFSETELLPKSEIIRLCRLFNSALDEYILEKCSWFPPRRIKQQFALAADRRIYTWLVRKFICYRHAEMLLDLRTRSFHRFLDEMPPEQVLEVAPLRLRQNTVVPANNHWVVNAESPFQFELSADELRFYEYFNGKLALGEIGRRIAGEQARPAEWGINKCLQVYARCEDKLASIAIV